MVQSYGSTAITSDGEEILVSLKQDPRHLDDDDQEFVDELWERMQDETGFTISTVEYMRLRVIWESSL